jgi:hypothetical protein
MVGAFVAVRRARTPILKPAMRASFGLLNLKLLEALSFGSAK